MADESQNSTHATPLWPTHHTARECPACGSKHAEVKLGVSLAPPTLYCRCLTCEFIWTVPQTSRNR